MTEEILQPILQAAAPKLLPKHCHFFFMRRGLECDHALLAAATGDATTGGAMVFLNNDQDLALFLLCNPPSTALLVRLTSAGLNGPVLSTHFAGDDAVGLARRFDAARATARARISAREPQLASAQTAVAQWAVHDASGDKQVGQLICLAFLPLPLLCTYLPNPFFVQRLVCMYSLASGGKMLGTSSLAHSFVLFFPL